MKRPGYHAYLPGPLQDLSERPTWVQLWLAWGYTWGVVGPLLCVRLWLEWWRA